MPLATDLVVEYDGDPSALDRLVQSLGPAVVGQDIDGSYSHAGGCYVIRVYGDPGYIRFALIHQGYVKRIVREEGIPARVEVQQSAPKGRRKA